MAARYDWDENQTARPTFMCQECGDLADSMWEFDLCFSLSEGIKKQWFVYLRDYQPKIWDLIKNNQRKG